MSLKNTIRRRAIKHLSDVAVDKVMDPSSGQTLGFLLETEAVVFTRNYPAIQHDMLAYCKSLIYAGNVYAVGEYLEPYVGTIDAIAFLKKCLHLVMEAKK